MNYQDALRLEDLISKGMTPEVVAAEPHEGGDNVVVMQEHIGYVKRIRIHPSEYQVTVEWDYPAARPPITGNYRYNGEIIYTRMRNEDILEVGMPETASTDDSNQEKLF